MPADYFTRCIGEPDSMMNEARVIDTNKQTPILPSLYEEGELKGSLRPVPDEIQQPEIFHQEDFDVNSETSDIKTVDAISRLIKCEPFEQWTSDSDAGGCTKAQDDSVKQSQCNQMHGSTTSY